MSRTIVHFIHGTWPFGFVPHHLRWLRRPEQTWIHKSSPFCEELQRLLPDAELVPFWWSGDNSYLERHRAAAALASRLMDYHSEPDPPRQVLVGHSHGGNVALLATMHPWTPALAGVATLATPFLNVERRTTSDRQQRLLRHIHTAAWFLVAGTVVVSLYALCGQLDQLSLGTQSSEGWWSFARGNAWFAVSSAALIWLLSSVITRAEALREQALGAYTWTFPRIVPWLILRAPGDEASLALALARIAHLSLVPVTRRMPAFIGRMSVGLRYYAFLFFLFVPLLWAPYLLQGFARWWVLGESVDVASRNVFPETVPQSLTALDRVVYLALRPILVLGTPIAAPILVALLLLGLLLLLAGACLAPFGWELVTTGLAFEATAETTPKGDEYSVRLVEPDSSSGLRHAVYNVPKARSHLADWIKHLPPPATGDGARHWTIHRETDPTQV